MEYPGRFIIIGRDPNDDYNVVVYGLTGRSPPSRARKLVHCANQRVEVQPTDEAAVSQGQRDLLIYPAIFYDTQGIAVSNGAQTLDVYTISAIAPHPLTGIEEGLKDWNYEPDAPNFTPRISGFVKDDDAVLSSIRKASNDSRQFWKWPVVFQKGQGQFISTYTGINQNPLPSFEGVPRDVSFSAGTHGGIAREVFSALNPEYRVAVAVLFQNRETKTYDIAIENRH